MSNVNELDQHSTEANDVAPEKEQGKENKYPDDKHEPQHRETQSETLSNISKTQGDTSQAEGRPVEREKAPGRTGARGTAAMDPQTRKEVARKGGLAVSRNKQHMAEIGRKGGQSVSKNREHMATIGRKGGAASRGHR